MKQVQLSKDHFEFNTLIILKKAQGRKFVKRVNIIH